MSRDSIFKCLIAFTLGYLFARMMRGNGLSVGGEEDDTKQKCISGESNDSGYCSPVKGLCTSGTNEEGKNILFPGIYKYINDKSFMCATVKNGKCQDWNKRICPSGDKTCEGRSPAENALDCQTDCFNDPNCIGYNYVQGHRGNNAQPNNVGQSTWDTQSQSGTYCYLYGNDLNRNAGTNSNLARYTDQRWANTWRPFKHGDGKIIKGADASDRQSKVIPLLRGDYDSGCVIKPAVDKCDSAECNKPVETMKRLCSNFLDQSI